MCEICSFKDDLPGWVKNNSNLDADEITSFCNRALAVLFELDNLGFEVEMGFSFREITDENEDAITQYQIPHVFVKGERFGNSIMVEFYTYNSVYVMSSSKTDGLVPCGKNSFEGMHYAKYIDDSTHNWECLASTCIESAINAANDTTSIDDNDTYEKKLLQEKLGGESHE